MAASRLYLSLKSHYHLLITEMHTNPGWTLVRLLPRRAENTPLLSAVREVPQALTGFSLFELLFGRRVLDLLKEEWEELEIRHPQPAWVIADQKEQLQQVC